MVSIRNQIHDSNTGIVKGPIPSIPHNRKQYKYDMSSISISNSTARLDGVYTVKIWRVGLCVSIVHTRTRCCIVSRFLPARTFCFHTRKLNERLLSPTGVMRGAREK